MLMDFNHQPAFFHPYFLGGFNWLEVGRCEISDSWPFMAYGCATKKAATCWSARVFLYEFPNKMEGTLW